MYKRKTKDVYVLMCDYGYGDGMEEVLEEDSWDEIKKRKKEYKENMPEYAYTIFKKRVRIGESV